MKKNILSLLLSISVLFSLDADEPKKFTREQKAEIETIIHDYLIDNPEVLPEAVQALQERKLREMEKNSVKVIKENAALIFSSKSPFLGNKDGSLYIVEFLDYNCPHCRHMNEILKDILSENKDIKLVIKEFPVFGDASIFAAKAALAAARQGKFQEMHDALLSEKGTLKIPMVLEIATRIGLNIVTLEQDMKLVDPELAEVKELATKMGIQGTPVLIVSRYPIKDDKKVFYIPGAVEKDVLQGTINQLK